MSLLSGILRGDAPEPAKRMGHLIALIKELGWDSFLDPRTIKPSTRRAELYLRKHDAELFKLFGKHFTKIPRDEIVDALNPLFVEMWQVQIIGDPMAASLQLLRKNTG